MVREDEAEGRGEESKEGRGQQRAESHDGAVL